MYLFSSLSISAMAAHSCDEEIPAIVDGNCDLAFGGSHFKLVKPSFDEFNQQCALDVVPILFEENSFSVEENCAIQAAHGQDVYSISMLSDEDKRNPKRTSQLTFLSFVELPVSPKKQMCLDSQLNCQNLIGLQMESANAYSPYVVDIDIEMENIERPKSDDKTIGSIKSDSLLTVSPSSLSYKVRPRKVIRMSKRKLKQQKDQQYGLEMVILGVLQRQASIKTCGKLMQLLKDHGSALVKMISKEKSFNDRVYDTPNNKWRKYKRAASFDSRKVVLLFSILSSFGTLILIYLTLRVRQTGDGFVNS